MGDISPDTIDSLIGLGLLIEERQIPPITKVLGVPMSAGRNRMVQVTQKGKLFSN